MRSEKMNLISYSVSSATANVKIEEVGQPRELDEDDDLVVDIITGVRSSAEESYTLPVLMDPDLDMTGQTAS